MKRIVLLLSISVLAIVILVSVHLAEAQQRKKIYRIGYLSNGKGTGRKHAVYRQALRDLGYVEGQNIVIEERFSTGKRDRLPALADELVRLRVDVLFASSITAALAAKNATRTIPIVFTSAADPVAAGLVDNRARPGGNLTGFTRTAAALAGKRLELLKETIPKLSRVAVLWQPGNPSSEQIWKESQVPARRLGLQLHSMEVSSADEIEGAFQEATKAVSAALAVTVSKLINSNRRRIASFAIKNRLPAIYVDSRFVRSGGLMSYGADRIEQYRRAATYVDRILKGAKPGDLPVERPAMFELYVNLKTAKELGLTIPPEILIRATKVIK